MDSAQKWGLPEGFTPLRLPIDDEVKSVVRGVLQPQEAVVVTIANESGTVTVIGTTSRLLTIKSGTAGAGVTGFQTKEYPWEALTNLVLQPASLNVVYRIDYKTSGGGKVEVGRRARMGKDASDKVMPFDTQDGTRAFEALYSILEHKKAEQAARGTEEDDLF